MQGVEKALEPDEVANHPEDAQEPHHPHRPHDLAGLLDLNQNLTIDRSPTCPIIFMFSSPARMTEKMVGRIPIRSTRFILSETNFLLFGQTSRRKKYLFIFILPNYLIGAHSMTKKAVAMLSMMWRMTSTSSCSLLASMRNIPGEIQIRCLPAQFLSFDGLSVLLDFCWVI